MQALNGRFAVVTGASAGIGLATATTLARAGANVVIAARRLDRLQELAASLAAIGGKILCVQTDAGDTKQVDGLVEQALAFSGGRLDIVVANAGHGLAGGVVTSDSSRWEEMYQVNVIGAAHLMRRSAEVMVKQRSGDIIAIGSCVGVNISPYSGFYGSTKFAIIAIAEALRREICQHQVRVTVIKPAVVDSEFQQVAGYTPENFGNLIKRYGKLLQPEDVARAIEFVVSQPPHVHINDLMIRPVGQDYP